MSSDHWYCRCGWCITSAELFSAEYDYPCPKCGRKLSTFHTKKEEPDEIPSTDH